jgi:hypothetical protein
MRAHEFTCYGVLFVLFAVASAWDPVVDCPDGEKRAEVQPIKVVDGSDTFDTTLARSVLYLLRVDKKLTATVHF